MDKKRYYYFFRGSLATHVDLYKGWVDTARKNGLPMEMLTILSISTYLKQHDLVKHYRKFDYIHIVVSPSVLTHFTAFLYFFVKAVSGNQLVVHLRKQSPKALDILKKIFKKKVKYIIELEGDPLSEREYLIKHPYKRDFYKDDIEKTNSFIRELPALIDKADGILTVTEKLRDLLNERYPELNMRDKTRVIPTGVYLDKINFSESNREKTRAKLKLKDKFTMIYIGNAYYSWQNVFRIIEIFQLIKTKINENSFLILLIRTPDHSIVNDFINKLNLSKEDYILCQVPHDSIKSYLNAADMGVLLRHPHVMNEVASPGKLGEYFAAGLPVLTTEVVAMFPKEISEQGYGIILDNMDDDAEILRKITPFLNYDKEKRAKISNWTKNKFSTEMYAQEYVNVLTKIDSNS
jgi:glycosyltransferase involved in cell wall biosynthesis